MWVLVAAGALGLVAGVLSGLFGVGGGILFVPTLTLVLGLTQLHAEASSLLAILPTAAVGAWRQRGYGNVRVREGLVIGALSPIGVAIGVVTSNTIPQRALELTFAGLALLIAAQLVIRSLRPNEQPTE